MEKPFYNLNIDSIKENIKAYLRTKPQFQNYNFEAPGIQIFLDQLAYTIFMSLYYTNSITNEFFLPTTKNIDNALKHANVLNYLPRRKVPAHIRAEVTNNSATTLVLPRYSRFTMEDITLLTDREYTIAPSETVLVRFIEGEVQSLVYVSNGEDFQSYIVPGGFSVSNDNIHVRTQVVGQVDLGELTQVNEGSFVVGQRNYLLRQTRELTVNFDNGAVTRVPISGEQILIEYVLTRGSEVNGLISDIEPSQQLISFGVDVDINVAENDTLRDGLEEENLENIQFNAPLFYSTNSRAVTEDDWNAIIRRFSQFENYADINLWGGDKEIVDSTGRIVFDDVYQDLGKVYVSSCYKDLENPFVSIFDISDMYDYMNKYKILTMQFVFRQPQMIKVTPSVQVKFKSNLNANIQEVKDVCLLYFNGITGYKKSFFPSQMVRFINNIDAVEYNIVDYTTEIKMFPGNRDVVRINNPIVPESISANIDIGVAGTLSDTPTSGGMGNLVHSTEGTIGQIRYSDGMMIFDQSVTFVQPYTISFELLNKDFITTDKEGFLYFEEDFNITVI